MQVAGRLVLMVELAQDILREEDMADKKITKFKLKGEDQK